MEWKQPKTGSIASHAGYFTHPSEVTQQERDAAGVHDGLLRVSVGLEDPEDIISDLEQVLAGLQGTRVPDDADHFPKGFGLNLAGCS